VQGEAAIHQQAERPSLDQTSGVAMKTFAGPNAGHESNTAGPVYKLNPPSDPHRCEAVVSALLPRQRWILRIPAGHQ